MSDPYPKPPLPPSYADLLRDHPEVIQGQDYVQEHGNQPDWHERQNPDVDQDTSKL